MNLSFAKSFMIAAGLTVSISASAQLNTRIDFYGESTFNGFTCAQNPSCLVPQQVTSGLQTQFSGTPIEFRNYAVNGYTIAQLLKLGGFNNNAGYFDACGLSKVDMSLHLKLIDSSSSIVAVNVGINDASTVDSQGFSKARTSVSDFTCRIGVLAKTIERTGKKLVFLIPNEVSNLLTINT